MARQLVGPAALARAALVARRYYLDERSKVEIAGELGLSRFKVARLLDIARDSGLVRIEIGHPGLIDVDLAAQIMDRFGLEHAVVVDTQDDHAESMRRHLGQVAAELLAEVIGPEDVLGVAWSRAVGAMAKSAAPPVLGAGRPAHRSHLDAGRRSQLDRRRARCRPSGRRAGIRLLRALHGARRRHRACPSPAARHRPSVRSTAQGHQGRRRTGTVGARAVNALRHSPGPRPQNAGAGSVCVPRCPACSSRPMESPCRPT